MKIIVVLVLMLLMFSSHSWADDKSLPLCDLSTAAGWKGLIPDSSLAYKGKPAAKWAHAQSPSSSIDKIPHDWSGFNCLSFAMHSAKATKTDIMLVLASETPSAEGFDYYSLRINLDWTGWKEFDIPFNEFSVNRQPTGWTRIDSINFTASGWNLTPHPDAVLHIANLRLTEVGSPSISDAELFQILNLDYPGLEKVKTAVESHDIEMARHEFAEYLRHREKPVWKSDWRARPIHTSRPADVDTVEADKVMDHNLVSIHIYHKFDGQIDWNLDPVNCREWPWQLSRHNIWITLGRAYWATGDEKYAREFVYQLNDWITRCPVPRYSSGNASYTWRTIEAGIRAGQTWMEVYHLFLTSPSFTDDAIILMVKSFVEHARHLKRWPTSGNWLTMEANGLMHVGVMFPEFKEAEDWRKTAAQRLFDELDRQVYPDGAQIELTTGYHQVSLNNFVWAWEIAHLNNIAMPEGYISKIEKMYDYNLKAVMPNGFLPGLNDANRTGIKSSMKKGFSFFPQRTDYEWLSSEGKTGKKPAIDSVALPFAGQLIMRTGWEKNDLYMLLDFGPFGYGHQHEDNLSLVIHAHGKYHLVDPGSYAYDSSKWRAYVISTRAHNTIMVDGLDQKRRGLKDTYVVSKPLPNKWIAGETFDYASGVYNDGYGPENKVRVKHQRNVFFVKPEYWIVTDFLTPEDSTSHLYESIFHLDADNAVVGDACSVRTDNKESGNLSILPVPDEGLTIDLVSGQEEPVVQGWMPFEPYKCRPIPTPVFKKTAPGSTHFIYVFYPSAQGKDCPIERIDPLKMEDAYSSKAVGAVIHFAGGRKDYYVQSAAPGQKIRFLDYETDASAVYVRTEKDVIKHACLAGGTGLKQAGKAIKAEMRPLEDLSRTNARHSM